MSNPDYAFYAVYVIATGKVLQTGVCPYGDLNLQTLNQAPGLAVMETDNPSGKRINRLRVDLSGEKPILKEV
jgi:hypothetical protein